MGCRDTSSDLQCSEAQDGWHSSPAGQGWAEVLEDLDIAIAERRCSDAVQLLAQADTAAKPLPVDWSDPDQHIRCAAGMASALDSDNSQPVVMKLQLLSSKSLGVQEQGMTTVLPQDSPLSLHRKCLEKYRPSEQTICTPLSQKDSTNP